ncbi:MFS transporter [Gilliamella sp. B3464]|uniref:MFS transporter n=1 Tax=unclassified Gilliamella TaxID=2685620 RepID=UPI00226AF7AE|nr:MULTISPECIES: MFS transporter [unclassified Gilliamella]MCX8711361.1 MFS transporter [Gilliamella sp. B3468]MCX8750738.1 MFS transporter [Gilliamella sp. B3464]
MDKLLIHKISYSNLCAQFSEQIIIAVLPIIAVLSIHASASETAFIQMINTLPFLLLSIPMGVLADRVSRKKLMIIMEIIRAAAIFILFYLTFLGNLTINKIALFGFFIAIGTVIYSVASPALVASFVIKDQLINANRSIEIAKSVAFTAGPAFGGILAGIYSGGLAFILAFLLSIISAFFLICLPKEPVQKKSERNIIQELCDGFIFLLKNKYLRPITITAFVFNLSFNLLLSIFAYYTINNLSFTSFEVGILLSLIGLGMFLGSVLYKFISTRINFGFQLTLGPVSAFVASILMLLTTIYPVKELVFISFFCFGFGPIIWTISTVSLRQLVTPNNMIAKISSVIMTVTFGARPLGAALGIYISANFGVTNCIFAVFIGFFIQLAIILFSKPANLKKLSDAEK